LRSIGSKNAHRIGLPDEAKEKLEEIDDAMLVADADVSTVEDTVEDYFVQLKRKKAGQLRQLEPGMGPRAHVKARDKGRGELLPAIRSVQEFYNLVTSSIRSEIAENTHVRRVVEMTRKLRSFYRDLLLEFRDKFERDPARRLEWRDTKTALNRLIFGVNTLFDSAQEAFLEQIKQTTETNNEWDSYKQISETDWKFSKQFE